MQEILDQLLSPVWCFSVVIVGIVVGVIANRSDRWLDRVLGRVSGRWRESSEKEIKKHEAKLHVLRESEKARQRQISLILWSGVRGLGLLIGLNIATTLGVSSQVSSEPWHMTSIDEWLLIGAFVFTAVLAIRLTMNAASNAELLYDALSDDDSMEEP